MKYVKAVLTAIVLLSLSACVHPVVMSTYSNRLRAAEMRSIAILPFENLTADTYAPSVVSDVLATTLYKSERFTVMERAETTRRLKGASFKLPKAVDLDTAVKAARELGVDGVLVGTIIEYTYLFYPEDAVFAVSLTLVDAETGRAVWSGFYNHRNTGLLQGSDEPITGLVQDGIDNLVTQFAPPLGSAPNKGGPALGAAAE